MEPESKVEKKPKLSFRKRHKTPIRLLFGLVVIVALVIAAHQIVSGPATGTITVKQPTTSQPTAPSHLVTLKGQYADITYPSYFSETKADPAVTPVLINYDFYRQQFGSWQLEIQINAIPGGNLDDNGSYHYRRLTPAQYAMTNESINGKSIPFFTDKTNATFNEVAFIANNTYDASISLMGGDGTNNNQMMAVLKAIVADWQWQ